MSPIPTSDRIFYPGQSAEVVRGRTVSFVAGASGRPTPHVSWRLPSKRLLRAGQSHGRVSVADNGDLQITNAQPKDSGRYIVYARNVAGTDRVLKRQKTQLTVYGIFSFTRNRLVSEYLFLQILPD